MFIHLACSHLGSEKVGRTIEFQRLQSIGNIDSSLTEEFVFLLLFREHRYRKRSIALRSILRHGKAKLRIPDRVLTALGVHRSVAPQREFDVGILLVKVWLSMRCCPLRTTMTSVPNTLDIVNWVGNDGMRRLGGRLRRDHSSKGQLSVLK
jgi:hypothetical protein